jgi:hypothetical protein
LPAQICPGRGDEFSTTLRQNSNRNFEQVCSGDGQKSSQLSVIWALNPIERRASGDYRLVVNSAGELTPENNKNFKTMTVTELNIELCLTRRFTHPV